MWRERYGLDAPALERAKLCLQEPAAWSKWEDDEGFVRFHHDVLPEFTLQTVDARDWTNCNQEWTRGEIQSDNNCACWHEIRYHQTMLRRVHHVSFDDHKKDMVAPDWKAVGRGRFYFYEADSVDYAVQRLLACNEGRDDSTGLRIRGDSEAAREAWSRWPSGLAIPVLESGELNLFLEGQRWDAIRGPDPATDTDEQHELFLRVLPDFEDWRRVWGS